jgi:2-dehydro-3-deoxy-D-arabinonate dehydratase
MKLGQIRWEGRVTAAVFEEGRSARPIPGYTLRQVVDECEKRQQTIHEFAKDHASKGLVEAEPAIPIDAREIWAAGCSYEMSASFRDAEHGTREGFYRHAFTAPRPEIFFKGTARTSTGPGGRIGIRADSKFTAPEPELAVLLGAKGHVLGYTLANDVSAWDIERENPLYLPQSKVYTGCCALGPWFVTVDEIADPYSLELSCTIRRGGKLLFEGATSTAKLGRKIEDLITFLLYANAVPTGSVLLTGTGIIVTQDAALAPGDAVSIACPSIGTLENEAMLVQ